MWRSSPDVQYHVYHVSLEGSHQLSHVGVPLKMEPSYGFGSRKALVSLDELDPRHERGKTASLKVTLSEVLREVASLIGEACEPYDLYLRYLQLFNGQYLHYSALSPGGNRPEPPSTGATGATPPPRDER